MQQSVPGTDTEFLCDPPRVARYVSLDINTTHPLVSDAIFMLAEVTVKEYTSGECPAPESKIFIMFGFQRVGYLLFCCQSVFFIV